MVGTVRFEVRFPNAPGTPPVPWMVGNPIYFTEPSVQPVPPSADDVIMPLSRDAAWHVEKDPDSIATISTSGGEVGVDYTLATGTRRSQFVAVAIDLPAGLPTFKAIAFSIRASHPARVSIQLRYPDGGGERWAKSVYVDAEGRASRIEVDRMIPADLQQGHAPDPSTARSLLFVVDLTNARPGDSNAVKISDVRFVK
jgi:hypothetical protein